MTSPAITQVPCPSNTIVFQDAIQTCGTYVDALQTCPISSADQQDRFQIVNQTSLCMSAVWLADGNSSSYSNYTNNLGTPPVIAANASCHYPDFTTILENACMYDYSQINFTCWSNGYVEPIRAQGSWTLCLTEAMLQYWRCTQQVSYDEVASCVEDNAAKIDWLPQLMTYNGAPSCASSNSVLGRQIASIVSDLATTFLSATIGAVLIEKLKRLFGFGKNHRQKAGSRGNATPGVELNTLPQSKDPYSIARQRPPDNIDGQEADDTARGWQWAPPGTFRPAERWVLKPSSVFTSIGKHILASYLTILILKKGELIGTASTQLSFLQVLSFYIIRPRGAPFTGLLGFLRGWSETGLGDVFADCALSVVAGTTVLVPFWFLFASPTDPAAPAQALKIVAVGAVLSSAPAWLFFIAVLILSTCLGLMGGGPIGSFLLFLLVPFLIALFLALLPIFALMEIIAMAWRKVRGLFGRKRDEKSDRRSCWDFWEAPLTFSSPSFRVVYALMVLSSIIINIGNWLFFASYLTLEGNMYCPSHLGTVTAVWVLVPVAVDLLYNLYVLMLN